MSYVYIRSEPRLWTVGTYAPDGTWEPESDHDSPQDAAARVTVLNGGPAPAAPVKPPTIHEAIDVLFRDRHSLASDIIRSLGDIWACASAAAYGEPAETWFTDDPEFYAAHDTATCEADSPPGCDECDRLALDCECWPPDPGVPYALTPKARSALDGGGAVSGREALDVDAIAARAEAAPGGYWLRTGDQVWMPWAVPGDADPVSPHDHGRYLAIEDGDWTAAPLTPPGLMDFLTRARDDVLALAAEVRRLRARLGTPMRKDAT